MMKLWNSRYGQLKRLSGSRGLTAAVYLLLVVASVGPANLAYAGNLYGSNPGSHAADCGTKAKPCENLHSLVERAAAGDRIMLLSGIFEMSEPVVLDKSRQTLMGVGRPENVILRGDGSNPEWPLVRLDGPRSWLGNVTLEPGEGQPAVIATGSRVRATNNRFKTRGGNAFEGYNVLGPRIEHNEFETLRGYVKLSAGIVLAPGNMDDPIGPVFPIISQNTFAGFKTGVSVTSFGERTRMRTFNNLFEDNQQGMIIHNFESGDFGELTPNDRRSGDRHVNNRFELNNEMLFNDPETQVIGMGIQGGNPHIKGLHASGTFGPITPTMIISLENTNGAIVEDSEATALDIVPVAQLHLLGLKDAQNQRLRRSLVRGMSVAFIRNGPLGVTSYVAERVDSILSCPIVVEEDVNSENVSATYQRYWDQKLGLVDSPYERDMIDLFERCPDSSRLIDATFSLASGPNC